MVVFVVCLFPSLLSAAGVAEVQVRFRPNEEPEPVPSFFISTQPIYKDFSLFGFAVAKEAWAQAYGGLIWSPTTWLSVSGGYGLEQPEGSRYAVSSTLKSGKFSLLGVYEKGADWWGRSIAKYNPTKEIGLGLYYHRGYGGGVYTEYNFQRLPISLWAAPTWDWEVEEYKGIVGVKFYSR